MGCLCRNLTYKAVAALKWISKHCAEATYVIKVDDDTFVNMFTVVKHLKDLYATKQRSRIIMCDVRWNGRVYRRGKWRVPIWVVPEKVYPPYCNGLFVIMSADVVRAAYRASFFVRFYWIDDVYVTGYLIQAMHRPIPGVSGKMGVTAGVGGIRSVRKSGRNMVSVTNGSELDVDRPLAAVGGEVGGTSGVGRPVGGAKGGDMGGEQAVRHVDINAATCNQTEMGVLYAHRTEWYKYAFTHVHDDHLFWSTWSALLAVARHFTIPTPSVIRPGVLADNYQSLSSIFPDIESRRQKWSEHEKIRLSKEYSNWRWKRRRHA